MNIGLTSHEQNDIGQKRIKLEKKEIENKNAQFISHDHEKIRAKIVEHKKVRLEITLEAATFSKPLM